MIVVKVDWQRCEVLQIQTVKKQLGQVLVKITPSHWAIGSLVIWAVYCLWIIEHKQLSHQILSARSFLLHVKRFFFVILCKFFLKWQKE